MSKEFKKGDTLELVTHGTKMRPSQQQVWERDYGKFPTEGDRVQVTNVRDDGWIEIKCVKPNYIRQYWPPEYFELVTTAQFSHQPCAVYREALEKIANPIKYLQDEAKKVNAKLDGVMAIQLSNDANFLIQLATAALSAAAVDGNKKNDK